MSFLTVLFLLSEFSFSIISSRVTDSALMYLCLTASYYLFVRAHQEISFKKLLIAAALASYAFLTREPALFYFPFYLIFLLYFYRRDKLFSLKQYFAGAGLFLGLCLAVPGIMMLYYGSQYIDTLRFSSAHGYTPQLSGIVIKARYFWDAHVNLILLPVAVAGLAILWIRQGWRFVAGLISVCFVPLLIILLVSEEALMLEPRIFMGYFFVMAFGLAYLTDVVAQFIYYTYRPFAIGAACIIFTYISAVRFLPDYRADLSKIQYLENYYESIKPLINKDVVIIIGEETLYVGYRGQADGIGPYFISPGWSWPTGKLVERLNKLLSENLTVIYDPRTRHYQAAKRSKDLDEMTETFTLTETKNGFIQVTLKK
jgi:4-amino-4-deoxy-L-arabinose transferase-like glycosyltransferase